VPTLNVAGWYDQEDFRGQLKLYEAFEKHDTADQNFIVVGPWNHGGWSGGPASQLGNIAWGSPTGPYYREKVQAPFFAKYLKDKGDKPPEATMFQTGLNQWKTFDAWPPKGAVKKTLYFHPDGKLAFEPAAAEGKDEYVSDPANPVPYRPRPINPTYQGPGWTTWMLEDQRFVHRRPDVLSYESDPLSEDLVVAGSMSVKIYGSMTGTDGDWIAKVIDVYPEDTPNGPRGAVMGGYQLMIMGEPVRARFRKSYEKPEPVTPGAVEEYSVDLHWNHHRFKKGHKVMVQIQSTWFPVIDRNPQKYVPNIYLAKDEDFQKATMAVHRGPKFPSGVVLEVLPEGK
jgi:putative CocE/NonD family hydrolase